MTAAKSYLLETLQRVIDGGDVDPDELDAAVPNPLDLNSVEFSAWQQLSHWADDADIRQKDEYYATFKREWMRHHVDVLKNNGT
jgi:hypothetical protein